jgi:eukaryotic-like serine/threonine-protein kinase
LSLTPGSRLGSYEIVSAIAAGGMGEVYRAHDPRLTRDVAIKILAAALSRDPDALARFEREAKSVAKLSHPNILAIHDVGRAGDLSFVVTELIDGETLRARLANGSLPARRAVAYAHQIARGIAAAHAGGIVHRDLKPENVMIGRDDQIKILDFGLARTVLPSALEETRIPTVHTNAGTVLGTFAYMAPEQVRGLSIDYRTDIFAFGAVLYEMLSGERAFKGETAADTMTAVLTREPLDLDVARLNIAPALDRIVRRCLEKSPELRFQSATDLAFALETLSASSSISGDSASAHSAGARSVSARSVSAHSAAARSVSVASAFRRKYLPWTVAAVAAAAVVGTWMGLPTRRAIAELPRFTRLTFRQGLISNARFAPDGQSIVYGASWDGDPPRIYPLRLDRPRAESQPIVDAALSAVSPLGDMAVRINPRFESMFAFRGTLGQMALGGGQPRPLLDRVDDAAYAPDGRIAVLRVAEGRTRLEFPAGTVVFETAGWISSPRFCPDGSCIAFHEHPLTDDDRGWPAMLHLATREKRALTKEYNTLAGLAFAPGGKEICFGSSATIQCVEVARSIVRIVAQAPVRLILNDIAPDGRILATGFNVQMRQVVGDARGQEIDLSWQDTPMPVEFSRDGTRLLFTDVGYGIYLRPVAGGPPVRLGDGTPMGLSPDGKWIVAIAPAVPTRLQLVPTGAGDTRILPRGSLEGHGWAVWTPDGRSVVLMGNEAGRGSRLYLQSVTNGDPVPISSEGVRLLRSASHSVSPDGRVVLGEGPDGVVGLYPIDGGAVLPIAGLDTDLVPIGWSDTPNVIFARQRGIERLADIYRVNVVSGRREKWRTLGPADPSGAPRLFSVQISPDATRYAYSVNNESFILYMIQGVF